MLLDLINRLVATTFNEIKSKQKCHLSEANCILYTLLSSRENKIQISEFSSVLAEFVRSSKIAKN